jgi:hypothetical protein
VTAEPSGVVDRVRRWNGGEFGIWSDDKGQAAFTITAIDEPDLGGASPTPHMCVQMQLWFAQNYPEAAELDTGNVAIQGRDLGDAIALLRCTMDKPDIVFAVAPDKRTALALVGVKPVSIAP